MDGQADAGVGRKRGEWKEAGSPGVQSWAHTRKYFFPRVGLQPPLGCRSPLEAGRYRAGCAGRGGGEAEELGRTGSGSTPRRGR